MQRARDYDKFEMPRFRDRADIFRDTSFSIDHYIPLSMDSMSHEKITPPLPVPFTRSLFV